MGIWGMAKNKNFPWGPTSITEVVNGLGWLAFTARVMPGGERDYPPSNYASCLEASEIGVIEEQTFECQCRWARQFGKKASVVCNTNIYCNPICRTEIVQFALPPTLPAITTLLWGREKGSERGMSRLRRGISGRPSLSSPTYPQAKWVAVAGSS